MHISRLAASLGQSATLKLNELAAGLKAEGRSVIHLGGGEPDEMIPDPAYEEALKKLRTRNIRYTPTSGIPELKDEIAVYTGKNYGLKATSKNIVVSSGAKQSIYNFLLAAIDPGDEVIFPAPYWVSYPEMVRMAYGTPVIVRPREGFIADIEDIERHITSNTKAVMLNSPNNPSGAVYPPEFVKKLVEICESRNIFLLMDDIYNGLVFDGARAPSAFSFSDRKLDDSVIVSVNGVSKMYAMTGFRIGWSVAGEVLSRAMAKVQAQTTSCPSALSQAAALGALRGSGTFTEDMRARLQKKRDVLVGELKKIKKVKIRVPQGTFYSFPDFSAYEPDSGKLAALLLERTLTVVVPGKEFGMDGCLRISYCGPEKDIVEGISRIRKVLDG